MTFSEISGRGEVLAGVFLGSCLCVCLFDYFLYWAWSATVWAYSVLPTPPPRSVSGLVWAIGSLSCGTGYVSRLVGWGFGVSCHLPCYFLFSFYLYSLFTFTCIFLAPPVAGDVAMFFADDFVLPLKATSSLHLFYVCCRLRCLAVQKCRSGF